MSPHPDEIAWVLAASEAVREALRGVSGPGWGIDAEPPFADAPAAYLLCGAHGSRRPWLPVSEVAIAQEAAERKVLGLPLPAWCVDSDPMSEQYVATAFAEGDDDNSVGNGVTPRLAALRLLAAVVEGA